MQRHGQLVGGEARQQLMQVVDDGADIVAVGRVWIISRIGIRETLAVAVVGDDGGQMLLTEVLEEVVGGLE